VRPARAASSGLLALRAFQDAERDLKAAGFEARKSPATVRLATKMCAARASASLRDATSSSISLKVCAFDAQL
jgi:hypothetical protein